MAAACRLAMWQLSGLDRRAVEGTGPLQDLLGQLQFGSRVGLVGVLLWQQRQHSSGLVVH